jgi:hypothetical protein
LGSSKTRTNEQELKGREIWYLKRSLKQPKIQQ